MHDMENNTDDRGLLPFDQVRNELIALCESGKNGDFWLYTEDRYTAIISLQDGDIVIIEKRHSAENGQSVVALINNEQVTLKKFYIEADGIRLQPANPDMTAILLKNEEVEVLGVVTGVIRQFE